MSEPVCVCHISMLASTMCNAHPQPLYGVVELDGLPAEGSKGAFFEIRDRELAAYKKWLDEQQAEFERRVFGADS